MSRLKVGSPIWVLSEMLETHGLDNRLKRQFSELASCLAEVYMDQILLNAHQQTLPGQYFHQKNDVETPRFIYDSASAQFALLEITPL